MKSAADQRRIGSNVPTDRKLRPAGLAGPRGHRRDLLRRLELARGGARPARLDPPPRVGQSGQQLGPLVLGSTRIMPKLHWLPPELVSLSAGGGQRADADCGSPAISGNGRYVAFDSG